MREFPLPVDPDTLSTISARRLPDGSRSGYGEPTPERIASLGLVLVLTRPRDEGASRYRNRNR